LKLFISYSHSDGPDVATKMREYFKKLRHTVFVSNLDIRVGDNWKKSINSAISTCNIFVVIITRGALNSNYVGYEIKRAVSLRKRIIPCRYVGIPRKDMKKWQLDRQQGIDFDDSPDLLRKLEAKLSEDIRGLRKMLGTVDNTIPRMKAFKRGGKPSDFKAGIIAKLEGDTIVFRDIRYRHTVRKITPDQFKNLDSQTHEFLVAYESSMLAGFRKWKKLVKSGKPHTNKRINKELRTIVHGICSDWEKIIDQLNRLGIRLEDHYYGIYGICEDYGYVRRQNY
jgi:signal peptidase I